MSSAPSGCLALLLFGILLLLPLFFANALLTALEELGLGPNAAVYAAMGIFLGGLVNIPVKKIPREQPMRSSPLVLFGLDRVVGSRGQRQYTIVAVNLGGCVIPCGLAAYELVRVAGQGGLLAVAVAVAINVALCYKLARPVENVGIALPPLVPALAAAAAALLLQPAHAPPVAFCAGVLGPLVGADLLNLGKIGKISTGVASIGGAGTFDGIVLSGLVATLLAA